MGHAILRKDKDKFKLQDEMPSYEGVPDLDLSPVSTATAEDSMDTDLRIQFSWLDRKINPYTECMICVLYENSPCHPITEELNRVIEKADTVKEQYEGKDKHLLESNEDYRALQKREKNLFKELSVCHGQHEELFAKRKQETQEKERHLIKSHAKE